MRHSGADELERLPHYINDTFVQNLAFAVRAQALRRNDYV